jgi:hypothetical protein
MYRTIRFLVALLLLPLLVVASSDAAARISDACSVECSDCPAAASDGACQGATGCLTCAVFAKFFAANSLLLPQRLSPASTDYTPATFFAPEGCSKDIDHPPQLS